MWYSAETRRDLFRALKRAFPEKPLPYTYAQMQKIGECVGIEHLLGLWFLRMDLREIAYDTWSQLRDEGDVQKSTRRDLIEKEIIKPAEILMRAISAGRKIGAAEAFALSSTPETSVDISQLQRDLRNLRDWAEAAKTRAMAKETDKGGSVPKGITVVRQNFVDRLFFLFSAITGDAPTRNVAKGSRYHEVSAFSRFVDLCAEPIFEQSHEFSPQIREAQIFHQAWLKASPPTEMPGHITDKKLEKIRRKIERKNP